ncbi:outer membrane protein [Companilactobacillus nantensis DSM 16982]|uniref:Outer membrane protein n=1 Tax=Companilactobacillus nantensis DSM 16982 TaxID=1423774 RepID=A0A0R1WLY2_9LACO|nr:outer membrane protein [Companilactobacillus nantensis DSM 16982]
MINTVASTTKTTTATISTVDTTPKAELIVSGLTGKDAVITDMKGNPVDPSSNLYSWENFNINYNWNIPDGEKINSGDTVTFELPSGITKVNDLTFPIYDSNNVQIGTASIKAGQTTGTITFNDALSNTTKNRHGTLSFIAKGSNNGDGNDGSNWMFNKNGWISGYAMTETSGKVPNELAWNLAFNPNSQTLTNVVLTDTLGPNQEYIPGSLTAMAGSFVNGSFQSNGQQLSPTVTTSGNKVIITFPGTITTAVDIYYTVRVIDPNLSGTNTWTNHATMGSSEGEHTVDSSTSWGGSGTGGGEPDTGSITLTKTDVTTGKVLAGAIYELKDSKGNVVDSAITTDADGQIRINDLPYGSYTLTEVKAPDGYVLNSTPIEITIPDNDKVDVSAEQKDTPEKGAVILKKIDALYGDTIAGATFNLLDKDGNVIKENLVTDGEGEIAITDLAPGEYQFVETKPAAGYLPSNTPIPFTVVAGQTTPIELTKLNNPILSDFDTGSVVFTKYGATLQTPLPGAVYDLLDSNKDVMLVDLKTNADGKFTIPSLMAGDYYFVETKAPDGYELNTTPIKFTITKDQEAQVTATDKPTPTEPGVTEPGEPKPPVTNPGPTEPGKPKPPVTNPGPTEPGKPKPPVTNPGPTEPGKPKPPVTNPGPTEPGKPKPPVTNPGPTEPGKPKPPVTNPGPTEPSKPTPPVTNPSEPAKPSPNPGPSVVYPSTDNNGSSSSVGTMPNANTGIGYGKDKLPQTGNENNLLLIIGGFFLALLVVLKHWIKKLS